MGISRVPIATNAGPNTYLCDSNAAVELDQVVEIAKCYRDRDKTDVARVS